MNYCTYDQYAAAGGTLDEAAFAPLAARASRLIDRMTFGRAEGPCRSVRRLCRGTGGRLHPIIDAANAMQSTCTPPGVSSVSNDGVSMTFTSGALAERLAAEAQAILANTLGSDPHNLLYRGVSDADARHSRHAAARHGHRNRPAVLQGAHGCSWRETRRTSASGDPPEGGAYPPPACAGLSALSPVGASAPRQRKLPTGRSSGAASSSAALSAA